MSIPLTEGFAALDRQRPRPKQPNAPADSRQLLGPQGFELVIGLAEQRYGLPPGVLYTALGHDTFASRPGWKRDGFGIWSDAPLHSIDNAARTLDLHLHQFPSIADGLAAYHLGPEYVQEHGGVPPYFATRRYVDGVMGDLSRAYQQTLSTSGSVPVGQGSPSRHAWANYQSPAAERANLGRSEIKRYTGSKAAPEHEAEVQSSFNALLHEPPDQTDAIERNKQAYGRAAVRVGGAIGRGFHAVSDKLRAVGPYTPIGMPQAITDRALGAISPWLHAHLPPLGEANDTALDIGRNLRDMGYDLAPYMVPILGQVGAAGQGAAVAGNAMQHGIGPTAAQIWSEMNPAEANLTIGERVARIVGLGAALYGGYHGATRLGGALSEPMTGAFERVRYGPEAARVAQAIRQTTNSGLSPGSAAQTLGADHPSAWNAANPGIRAETAAAKPTSRIIRIQTERNPYFSSSSSPESSSPINEYSPEAPGNRKTYLAAKRIQEKNSPTVNRHMEDKDVLRDLTKSMKADLEKWLQKNREYKSFYREDIQLANRMVRNYVKEHFGREITPGELDLFHYLSSMGAPLANPVFDSSTGIRLLDRYLRHGQISPYVGDSELMVRNIEGKPVAVGIPKVRDGVIAGGAYGKAFSTRGVLNLANLLDGHFGGDLEKTMEWLKQKHSVEVIEQMTGRKVPRSEFTEGGQAYGAFGVTGSKLASYYLNRVGVMDTVTKDMWFARTMARYLGSPLVKANDKTLTEPWDPGTNEGLRLRKLADQAIINAGKYFKWSPAEVQERLWDLEHQLYKDHGASQSATYISQGTQRGIDHINRGERFDPYEAGKPATASQIEQHGIWKSLAELGRNLYGDSPAKKTLGFGGTQSSGEIGGYKRVPSQTDSVGNDAERITLSALDDAKSVPVVARFEPGRHLTRALSTIGGRALTFYEITDPLAFQDLVRNAEGQLPVGSAANPLSSDDLRNARMFVSQDGTSGFALSDDRILNPFSTSRGVRGVYSALQLALDLGGRKIVTDNAIQPHTFAPMGFRGVARVFRDLPIDGTHARVGLPSEPLEHVHMVWDPANLRHYEPERVRAAQSHLEADRIVSDELSKLRSKLPKNSRSRLRY